MILHLIDASQDDVVDAYKTIREECKQYGGGIVDKPEILILNKIDLLDSDTLAEKVTALEKASKKDILLISAAAGKGVDSVLYDAFEHIKERRDTMAECPVPSFEQDM